MAIVADTTVFRYLVVLEVTAILPALFEQVLLPPAVVSELQHASTPASVRQWTTTLPAWVRVQAPGLPPDPTLSHLGAGEREALQLMVEQQASILVTDDRDAYTAALRLGLPVTRTLRILEMAAERDLLDLPTTVHQLRAAGFYTPVDVVAAMLARDAARKTAGGPATPEGQAPA
jgi:predicted nucleic acid-binding protein